MRVDQVARIELTLNNKLVCTYIFVILVFTYHTQGIAAVNTFTFRNNLSLSSNNNFLWMDENERSREALIIEPELYLGRESVTSETNVNIKYSIEKYNREFYDVNIPSGSIYQRSTFSKNTYTLKASGRRLSSRITDISNTGVLEEHLSERHISNGAFSWTHRLSSLTSVNWEITGSNTQYESVRLADYKLYGSELSSNTRLNAKQSVSLAYRVSRYKSEFNSIFPAPAETYQNVVLLPARLENGLAQTNAWMHDVNLGFLQKLGKKKSLALLAGFSRVDTDQSIRSRGQKMSLPFPLSGEYIPENATRYNTQKTSSNFRLNYQYVHKRGQVSLSATRTSGVSSIGTIQKQNTASFHTRYAINHKITASTNLRLGAVKVDREGFTSLDYGDDRKYYQFEIASELKFNRKLYMKAMVNFFGQRYETLDERAKGTSGTLSLVYQPNRKTW